ncbi:hypothetical protein TSOC_011083 [Tetrabaena socialis]|uniref:Uncharacterized protein n=1 Tax=Tetrabaena socialis TaxID=47790 RepID=A0A2J7ZRM6_9CHLO|nr:hypothetical protein TSOC_011083 [Tetrabaena socialis]|eukprot:PNH02908.1 hypothetical protein TSOC_011083 [Tetrabaena socialis]
MSLLAPAPIERLARLAEEAARLAHIATGFTQHVDKALHAPVSPEQAELEGQFGRAAGGYSSEAGTPLRPQLTGAQQPGYARAGRGSGLQQLILVALCAVGLAYSSWFWWRYVLFAEGRRELRSRVKGLRSRAAETLDGLTERTRDLQPPPVEDPSSGREVVERLAARHTQQQGSVISGRSDDGSWITINEPRGALEREEMEKLAATHKREGVPPSSMRKPSVAEQAGIGP